MFERLTWPLTLTLTINRDHLLIKDYLPTKFEASGTKRSRVIRCTMFEGLTWPFDLLTWLSIGIIYSSRTIYLPSLKFLGQSVPELSVAQCLRDWHDLWSWPWLSIGIIYSSRTIYLRSLKRLGQSVPELSVAQCLRDWHDLWPTDLTIHRDHLLIKDYLPTKFEVSGAKRSRVIRCTMFERLTWPLTLTLTINRDHLLIKDYLPTKFEASGSKRSRVIRCTMFERLTWLLTYWPDYQ